MSSTLSVSLRRWVVLGGRDIGACGRAISYLAAKLVVTQPRPQRTLGCKATLLPRYNQVTVTDLTAGTYGLVTVDTQ